jgi:tight adherence protein B
MDPIALLAALCILGAIVLGMLGIHRATASPRTGLERRLGRLMSDSMDAELEAVAAFETFRRSRKGSLPIIGMIGSGQNQLAEDLERADIKLTVSEFLAIRIFVMAMFAGVPYLILGGMVGIVAALGLGFVGYLLPKIWVSRAKNKRIDRLNAQLPDALTMIANSLKAGFGLMQSLELASRELAHPLATEIKRMLQDINVGMATDEALMNFSKRSGSADLDIVVTAMLIQQSTGGNLAEILDTVGHTMRERIRIRGEIKTLTTQQMMTGFIIGGLPVVIGGAVSLLNPEYIEPLFTTFPGQVMLGGAVILEGFGVAVIKKILMIEV